MNICQCGCGVKVNNKWSIGHNRRNVSPTNKIGYTMNGTKYVWICTPMHPRANKMGYVKRCYLVIESSIGRHIEHNEVVHHINGNCSDDRMDNLLLLTKKQHDRISVLISEKCLHPDCDNIHAARGLCKSHYMKYKRSKRIMPFKPSRKNRWTREAISYDS